MFCRQVPPTPSARSTINRSSIPLRRNATAAASPPKPAPMITTRGDLPRRVSARRRPVRYRPRLVIEGYPADLEPFRCAVARGTPRGCRRIRSGCRRRSCPDASSRSPDLRGCSSPACKISPVRRSPPIVRRSCRPMPIRRSAVASSSFDVIAQRPRDHLCACDAPARQGDTGSSR